LPLTAQNHSILSAQVLKKLPEQACVINCGRGQHLVLPDLVAALDSGHLRGAVLDVFEREPLEQADPLWTHEKVLITPHVASHAPMSIVVEQILENDRRYKEYEPLNHQIDPARGY
jgi:glyoxylate/hydroxypyruvate reductase A